MNVNEINAQDVKEMLSEQAVRLRFTKKTTGEERIMIATNHPYVTTREDIAPKGTRESKRPHNLITTYDLQKHGWRTFYFENLNEVEPLLIKIREGVMPNVDGQA